MTSRSGHSQHHPKLKAPTRALFSCGMFRNCTQTVLSPTKTAPPPPAATTTTMTTPPPSSGLPPPSSSPPPPLPLPTQLEKEHAQSSVPTATAATAAEPEGRHPLSSSSSSSSTSQSFTQWRFPLTHPPSESSDHRLHQESDFATSTDDLSGAFHVAELHLSSGNRIPALRLIERCLALDPGAAAVPCPLPVMAGVVASILDPAAARPAAKVLLALLLSESNRRLAVEAKAAPAAVEAVAAASTSGAAGAATAERALAALELICTVPEGAVEVRRNPTAAGSLVAAVEKMVGRGRESAIGVLSAIYAGQWAGAAPPEVGRTVVMALQGDCTPRGRRKGAKLLKALKEAGRLDLPDDGC